MWRLARPIDTGSLRLPHQPGQSSTLETRLNAELLACRRPGGTTRIGLAELGVGQIAAYRPAGPSRCPVCHTEVIDRPRNRTSGRLGRCRSSRHRRSTRKSRADRQSELSGAPWQQHLRRGLLDGLTVCRCHLMRPEKNRGRQQAKTECQWKCAFYTLVKLPRVHALRRRLRT